MLRFRVLAAACLMSAASLAVAPAHAAEVCSENNQLTFSPPLGATMTTGTVRIDFQGSCPDAPGLTPRTYSGSVTTTYFGSCALAFFDEGGTSVYVGGVGYTFVRGTVQVKAELMTPDFVCPLATARGTGVLVSIPEVPGN